MTMITKQQYSNDNINYYVQDKMYTNYIQTVQQLATYNERVARWLVNITQAV